MTLAILVIGGTNLVLAIVATIQRQVAVRHTLEKEKRRREKIQAKLDAGHMKKKQR